jgi:flagellar biosynthesis/type III secretory pathway M-ring protein FliF/YscJ
LEGLFAEAARVIFTTTGFAGAIAILAIIGLVVALRELRDTFKEGSKDRSELQEKRLAETTALALTVERNTNAMAEATRTAESRAQALTKLSEAVAANTAAVAALREEWIRKDRGG